MSDITSDTAVPQITADGNFDIINLQPGATYALKFSGTFEATTLSIQVKDGDGTFHSLDDAAAAGIDGTATTEFQIVTIGTAIRIVAANTGTAPTIKVTATLVV